MSETANKIILGFLLFILTIVMNTIYRPNTIKTVEPSAVHKIVTSVETKSIETHSNFTNNQKAAFFFAFPLGGMIWITGYSLFRNRKKIHKAIKIEREPRVVFN